MKRLEDPRGHGELYLRKFADTDNFYLNVVPRYKDDLRLNESDYEDFMRAVKTHWLRRKIGSLRLFKWWLHK